MTFNNLIALISNTDESLSFHVLSLKLQGFTNDFRQISELIEDFEAGDKSEDDRTSFSILF